MTVDAENKIVKLCAAGITAEMEGDVLAAMKCYNSAWEEKTSDYEACIAAHYLARLQNSAEAMLYWNEMALEYANNVAYELVAAFYPSLYLNVGKCYEDMGEHRKALECYYTGVDKTGELPDDRLGNITRAALLQHIQNIEAKNLEGYPE